VFGAPKIVPEQEPEADPLFELTPELIDAATLEERDAIINDGARVLVETRHDFTGFDVNEAEKRRPGTAADFHALACEALTILLASLAARNVVKDVRYNGRCEIGGKSQPIHLGGGGITYLSRTIVRPPRIEDVKEIDPEHPPRAGLAKLLLVRGFIRNQVADTTKPQPPDVRITVVGTGRAGRREQWIAPYYRGVDPAYVPTRHYVVRP
jgi:hypothetical protein